MSMPHSGSRRRASPGPRAGAGAWLVPLAGHWIDAARTHLSRHASLVRVTVTRLRGSAPREAGATMLVDAVGTVGTIGGGRLEWHAVGLARELLRDACAAPVRIADLILGPELGQCCGGRVELWLERLTRADAHWLKNAACRLRAEQGLAIATELIDGAVNHRLLRRSFMGAAALEIESRPDGRTTLFEAPRPRRPDLWIFGAGHVGQALVRLLAELALFEITWIDTRAELLPESLPEGVSPQVCAAPAELAVRAPAGTHFVVMTHDHALDYELCRVILSRADSSWLGLIGSASKSARFRSRLLRDGHDRETVARLMCPIGVPGMVSKLPGAIAIAIAAQLLQRPSAPRLRGAGEVPRPGTDVSGCARDCGSCADLHGRAQ